MSLDRPFSLAVYQPLNGSVTPPNPVVLPLDPEVTSLQLVSALPGGFNAAKVGLRDDLPLKDMPWLSPPAEVPEWAHVEVWAHNTTIWEGRVSMPDLIGARTRGFDALSYGVWALDDAVLYTASDAPTTAQGLFMDAIGAPGPVVFTVDWSTFQAPVVQHFLSELNGQTPNQIIQRLSKDGDGASTPWDFACYAGRVCTFRPRICPTDSNGNPQPDYLIDWDDTVTAKLDYTNTVGQVLVQYTDAGSGASLIASEPITEPTFVSRYGFLRQKLLPCGTTTLAEANAFAAVWLKQNAWPLFKGSVTRNQSRGLETFPAMAPIPAYLPRAGQWVQIGDGQQIPPQIIVRATADLFTKSYTFELGSPAAGYGALVQELRVVADNIKRNTSPNSGARLI